MSIESLIPMVNRWLEGVHSAMAISSASQDESSEDEIEDEEDAELSSPTSDTTASTTAVRRSAHEYDKRKSFKSRFFKSTKEKYIDYNDNAVADDQPDLLPHIASKRSLSTEDLPRNSERYSGHYDIEDNSQEAYFCYRHTKRESFDSTVAQRPFSPCSTLAASDQFSVCEEDIVLMSPRFRGISSQRRASDGMVQRIPQWTTQESNQGIFSSSNDLNGTCSRGSSRPSTPATPTTPVSPFIKIKASGGFKLPPLNAPNPRRPKLQELPSITISDNSGSGSQGSLESFPDEQPCASSKHLEQTYLNPAEGKSFFAVKNAKHLLQRRRGSLPTVMSAIRQSALPIVKEENPHAEERQKKPGPSSDNKSVNLQIPRHRFRSKSLDGQLGTASEWEQYKARAMERRAQLP